MTHNIESEPTLQDVISKMQAFEKLLMNMVFHVESIRTLCVEKGVLLDQDINNRIAEVKAYRDFALQLITDNERGYHDVSFKPSSGDIVILNLKVKLKNEDGFYVLIEESKNVRLLLDHNNQDSRRLTTLIESITGLPDLSWKDLQTVDYEEATDTGINSYIMEYAIVVVRSMRVDVSVVDHE